MHKQWRCDTPTPSLAHRSTYVDGDTFFLAMYTGYRNGAVCVVGACSVFTLVDDEEAITLALTPWGSVHHLLTIFRFFASLLRLVKPSRG